MFVITNFKSDQKEIALREAIILSARVHPGESGASYIVEGIIEFLLSNNSKANFLR